MRIINLASGSDGNLTYIETASSKILLDDGLSCQETVKRLQLLGVSPNQIDALLVTHKHIDHIKGADNFSDRFGVPIFAHEDVWQDGLEEKLCKTKSANRKFFDGKFQLRDIVVTPIEVSHDVKCFAYTLQNENAKVSVVTDLGKTNDLLFDQVASSQLVYLEANYDKEMLARGVNYPLALKRRIAGPHGHLSNDDSAAAIERLVQTGTRQIVLSHLSKENNTPDLAYQYITDKLAKRGIEEGVDLRIDVASPRPGVIFRIK